MFIGVFVRWGDGGSRNTPEELGRSSRQLVSGSPTVISRSSVPRLRTALAVKFKCPIEPLDEILPRVIAITLVEVLCQVPAYFLCRELGIAPFVFTPKHRGCQYPPGIRLPRLTTHDQYQIIALGTTGCLDCMGKGCGFFPDLELDPHHEIRFRHLLRWSCDEGD